MMDALVDLAMERGALGVAIGLLVAGALVGYRIGYRHWRDLVEERNAWRDYALRALQAGESLVGHKSGGEDEG